MSKAGDEAGALGPTREALDIYRRLAQKDPEEFLPYLALTLNNLGLRLSATGNTQAALEPSREAVAIARRLAEEDPARLPGLASALDGLGTRLVQAGDRSAGFETIAEAVGIQRRLADEAPAAHLPKLAVMLNGLGARLVLAGDDADAVAPLRKAVDIRRRLAEAQPLTHLPSLVMSLINLGQSLSRVGDKAAAAQAVQEAIDICRRAPSTLHYRTDLAVALNALGLILAETEDRNGAVDAATESVSILQDLVSEDPHVQGGPPVHLPLLAQSLESLGRRLSEIGQGPEALRPAREAVDIRRRLAESKATADLSDLARSLRLAASIGDAHGIDLDTSLNAVHESISIYQALPAQDAETSREELAEAERTRARIVERLER